MLDAETQVLEKEFTKWKHLELSAKERIKASEFDKDVQQSMQLKNKQL